MASEKNLGHPNINLNATYLDNILPQGWGSTILEQQGLINEDKLIQQTGDVKPNNPRFPTVNISIYSQLII